ncbi:permease [Sulfobacillus acidophilus TPY]|uniref:AI-2E family transporter n=1 Tax=Sulfobacillus acidophilus (strain ATCC 700253 / DSM 10332 / NAL) TaxID=679936 RepID=G8TY93_SULAD|nr:permease [Sulfobacillus acidophilus TPY]AEW05057.1 protein of unknown function UPF0118 [Sulfobacillus acidophilus DSM 10332]
MAEFPVVTKSPLRWVRWGLLLGVTAGAIGLVDAAHAILMPFVVSLVLAYLLAPLVELFVRHGRLSRVLAILLVYGLLGLLLAALLVYMLPVLVQESLRLIRIVPAFAQDLQSSWDYWLMRFHQAPMPAPVRQNIHQTALHLESLLVTSVQRFLHALFGLVPGVISILVAPVMAFYVLKDLNRVRERFWTVVPVSWHGAIFKLGFDIDRALNGYIRGQLMVAFIVGLLSALWMVILGIPFAALIGALAGITDVIPYVGPIAGAIPAVALALAKSPWLAVYTVFGFILIHQLEGTVIAPKVVGDSVGLHPLVVIFAILAGGAIFGFVGLLLGVPLAAVLKVVLSHLYRRLSVTLDHDSVTSVQ